IGPAASFPTSTSPNVGSQSTWGLGPSADAVAQAHPWVIGVLANNLWSTAGDSSNQMLLQYFINYNFKKGWYLTSSPIITANWKAASGQKWVVPFGAGFGKLFKLGKLPFNGNVSAYYNAVKPDIGPGVDAPRPARDSAAQVTALGTADLRQPPLRPAVHAAVEAVAPRVAADPRSASIPSLRLFGAHSLLQSQDTRSVPALGPIVSVAIATR